MTNAATEFYDRRYRVSSGKLNHHQLARLDPILRYVGAGQDGSHPRLLDVGCGTGWLSEQLAQVGDVWGVDISEEAVRRARLRVPGGVFETLDFVAAPPHWDPFDVVVCSEVLEHLVDHERGIARLAALTRPGGRLVLTTPNFDRARPADFSPDLLQPVENWVSAAGLRRLLGRAFDIRRMTTAYLEQDHRGVYRLINSGRLVRCLKAASLDGIWRRAWQSAGFGLYRIVLAVRKESA